MTQDSSPVPTKTDLRKFVLRCELFLLVWGLVWLHRHWQVFGYWVAGCLLILVPSLLFPSVYARPRHGLQKIAHALGTTATIGLLAVVYVAVMIPLGLIARRFGKQFITMRPDARLRTYWTPKNTDASSSRERQY